MVEDRHGHAFAEQRQHRSRCRRGAEEHDQLGIKTMLGEPARQVDAYAVGAALAQLMQSEEDSGGPAHLGRGTFRWF